VTPSFPGEDPVHLAEETLRTYSGAPTLAIGGLALRAETSATLWSRVEFPELKRQVGTQATARHPSAVLEDTASGQSLIQELRTTNPPIPAGQGRQ
jgi:hypothetical protein